jgi:hypothetical protein
LALEDNPKESPYSQIIRWVLEEKKELTTLGLKRQGHPAGTALKSLKKASRDLLQVCVWIRIAIDATRGVKTPV